jgi:hypothetical protein
MTELKRLLLAIGTLTAAILSGFYIYISHYAANQGRSVDKLPYTQQTEKPKNIDTAVVPLPQQEDTIRLFFELIDEKRIDEAINMMLPIAVENDSKKQAWAVQFNAFNKLSIISISPVDNNLYKVVFGATMNPESANEVIPYFGYFNGENTRWISLDKINGLWKIAGIHTGP